MSASSRKLDRFATTFDHEGLVANAGLILAGTLMARLGLSALIERWVRTGSANPGPKILTVVAADGRGRHPHRSRRDAARRTHREGAGVSARWRRPRWGRSCGRSRSATSASSKRCCRARWRAPGGWARAPARRRWWSIWTPRSARSTANKSKEPRTATPACSAITRCSLHGADTGEVLGARMRKGSAGSSRGVVRFVDELAANLRRAGAVGPTTVRADSGFWSWKLIDRLDGHDFKWSITVALIPAVRAAIQAIRDDAWADIAYTKGGHAQVAETTYATGRGKQKRTVRLVVRRTRLTEGAQQQLWPDWRHHAFITNTEHDTAEADRFHRAHAVVELAIRDLKEGTGLEHVPSGHYSANCAWLACAALAHNIGHWTTALAGASPATNRSRRTRLVALAAVAVNRLRHTHPAIPRPLALGHTIHNHTRSPASPARTLRLTPNPPGTGAPTQTQRQHNPNHTPTPSPTRPNTPNHTPNNPTRPPTATDPRTPRSPKANRWIQAYADLRVCGVILNSSTFSGCADDRNGSTCSALVQVKSSRRVSGTAATGPCDIAP